LAVFFVLAYLLSWSWWIPIFVSGGVVRAGIGWPTHLPGLLGPLIAAVVTTGVANGRPGLRRLARSIFRWRAGWWWLAIPITLVAGGIGVFASGATVSVTDLTNYSGVSSELGAVLTIVLVFAVNGIGEEAGWRGFAAHRLLAHRSIVTTSLLVGIAWAGWHLPLFFIVDAFRGFSPPGIVGWVLGLTCGSLVLTWLFRRSGGSVLLVAAWHTAYNFTSLTPVSAAVTSMLVLAAALVVVGLGVREHRLARRTLGTGMIRRDPAGLS
jgi:membrane protease YdiL (CAAX protease family)